MADSTSALQRPPSLQTFLDAGCELGPVGVWVERLAEVAYLDLPLTPPGEREGVQSSVRLSEPLAAVSLGTDLGMGHPMEHVLRQTVIALRLAERLGLTPTERESVYYSSLLAWVECHVDAYEQAKWFGDDLALKHEIRFVDEGRIPVNAGRPVGSGSTSPIVSV